MSDKDKKELDIVDVYGTKDATLKQFRKTGIYL